MYKKKLTLIITFILILTLSLIGFIRVRDRVVMTRDVLGLATLRSVQIGSGPASGDILTTNGTSSSWVTPGGLGLESNWAYGTTYNELSLTPSTTIPVWLKDTLYASSTAFIDGATTLGSTLSVTGLTTATGGILSLSSTTLQNFTFTNATGTAATTTRFSAGALNISGTTATSTFAGGLRVTGSQGVRFDNFNCSALGNGGKLTTDSSGNIICSADDSTTGASDPDWQKETTYNELSLTPTTTIPVWLKDTLYASSTSFFSATSTFLSDLVVDTNTFFVDSANNRVSIGSTSPLSVLSVDGSYATNPLATLRSTDGDSAGTFLRFAFSENTGPEGDEKAFSLVNQGSANNGEQGYVSAIANAKGMKVYGTNVLQLDAGTKVISDSTTFGIGTTSPWTRLGINSSSGQYLMALSVNGTNKVVIDENGFYGFNTTNPSAALDLNAPSNNIAFNVSAPDITSAPAFLLTVPDGNGITAGKAFAIVRTGEAYATTQFASDGGMGFGPGGGSTRDVWLSRHSTNSFIIDSNRAGGSANLYITGKLGIGTTSPYAKLSVVGNVVMSTFHATSTATSTIDGNLRVVGLLDASDIAFNNLKGERTWTVTEGDRVGEREGDLVFVNKRGENAFILHQDGTFSGGQGDEGSHGYWYLLGLLGLLGLMPRKRSGKE